MIEQIVALSGLLSAVVVVLKWRHRLERKRTLEAYGRRAKDIYVYSLSEADETVFERAQQERRLLLESGNQTKVKVHEIYFQDGARPGASSENWEVFLAYVRAYQEENDEARERWLNSQGRAWYLQNVKHQRGIEKVA